ncbi:hypothetical protein CONLIGDRAFT_678089 [Coniochaeta ligniaria NRRL 30616]|uniref:Transmembrane protein n=1 Tax=Coniochaeta ligniaria NRRL 30616 TaxID=1408157 RepID=A0A1J7IV97_9PEZI|nr:hypothetical protein CONLIGDRAFT_678089 [Coniochaeta ligniaria NRRL 30616]
MSGTRSSRSGAPSPEEQLEPSVDQVAPLPVVSHTTSKSVLEEHMSRETSLYAPRMIPGGMQSSSENVKIVKTAKVVRPFPPSMTALMTKNYASWALLLCLGVGGLFVEHLFVSWAQRYSNMTVVPFGKLLNDLFEAGILRPSRKHDSTSKSGGEQSAQSLVELVGSWLAGGQSTQSLEKTETNWHLQGVDGLDAQSTRKIVIDGLILKGRAIAVFSKATSVLTLPVLVARPEAYLSLLQLAEAWHEIARDKPTEQWAVDALSKARHEFVGLLRSAKGYYRDCRRDLDKIIADIEADGGYQPAPASRA